jgi:hypothetical protein
MTRANVLEDMSMLLLMCILLYLDRTTRNESIFDSNAVTMSILLSHMFNLLRVREVPVEGIFVVVQEDQSTELSSLAVLVQCIYCAVSLMLVSDYSIFDLVWGRLSSECSYMTATLSVHCICMGVVVFIHVNPDGISQTNMIARSLIFTILSILWSYVVGVKNTINALQMKEDCKVVTPLRLSLSDA